MKTHGNQPNEIALLNHVSAMLAKPATSFIVWTWKTSGLVLFAKKSHPAAYWEKRDF